MKSNKTVGSRTLEIYENLGGWRLVIWFITQIITGTAWTKYLVANTVITFPTMDKLMTADGWYAVLKIVFMFLGEFAFAWIAYLILSFYLEGKFMDWAIKLGHLIGLWWKRMLEGGTLTPDDATLYRALKLELFSLGSLSFSFLFCGFCTFGDWYISSYLRLEKAPTLTGQIIIGIVMFIFVIGGETLLQQKNVSEEMAAITEDPPAELSPAPVSPQTTARHSEAMKRIRENHLRK